MVEIRRLSEKNILKRSVSIDLIKKLIIWIVVVLVLLNICITIDFADETITADNLTTEQTIKQFNKSDIIILNDTYPSDNDIGVAKIQNIVTVKSKVPLIKITAKPSCSCGRKYSYKWRTRTFVNYCPHCHRYNALVNKHKYPARYEQELTCKYDDCDYCGNCGKEKYSWSNYRLSKV